MGKPAPVEPWTVLLVSSRVDGTEQFSTALSVSTGAPVIGGGCVGVEVDVSTGVALPGPEALVQTYSCPDGEAANRSSTPVGGLSVTLPESNRATFFVPAVQVGSGVVFGAVRTGSGLLGPVVTIRARRYVGGVK